MMHIMHIALGGCLSPEPIDYGITEDTGGHIAYVLGASAAQARRDDVRRVDLVTRRFRGDRFGARYWAEATPMGPKRQILRLATPTERYLEKDALAAELPALERAFLTLLEAQGRPDLIHAHFADAAVLARAAERRWGVPWIYSSHSLALQKDRSATPGQTARIARERAAIRGAGAIVASSRDEAERQIAAYDVEANGRVRCIAPGIAARAPVGPEAAEALIAPFLRAPEKPILLLIARPVIKKNIPALLNAYAASPALQDRANLVIVAGQRSAIGGDGDGDGDPGARESARLFDLVDRHDLWGRVALPRRHSQAEVASLYALAARGGVFVNPAFHEPFGLTVVEAAQAGVPVVATRNGGPSEVLAAIGYGATIDPERPDEIAAACLTLLQDPMRNARIRAARDAALRRFDWDRWAADVADLAAELRAPARPAAARPQRILYADIDNTLTGCHAGARALRARLGRVRGLELVPATGRSINEALRVLKIWGYAPPERIITSVGTEIWHRRPRGGYALDHAWAERISDGWDRDAILALARACGARMQAPHEHRPWKISALGDAEAATRIGSALAGQGYAARVVHSHGRLIDILPAEAGKAGAAAYLAKRLGVAEPDCIAAGDSGNDADLLAWAAVSILPANASAELDHLTGAHLIRSPKTYAAGVLDGFRTRLAPPSHQIAAE